MSQTELHVGTLKPVEKVSENETNEQIILRLLGSIPIQQDEDLFEKLQEEDENYFLFNGIIYKADNKEFDDGDDICEASLQSDGTIKYTLKFYNGGTYFIEMMNDALKKITP